jgi:hypothetical protein
MQVRKEVSQTVGSMWVETEEKLCEARDRWTNFRRKLIGKYTSQ